MVDQEGVPVRGRSLSVAVGIALLFSVSGAARGEDAAVEISDIDAGAFPEVVLHVRVLDGAGRNIPGLKGNDFKVFEDGQPVQELKTDLVFLKEEGLGVVLAIDISGSMSGAPLKAAKGSALDFIDRLSPQDVSAVVTFGDRVSTVVRPGGNPDPAIQALGASDATTHLYDGILSAAELAGKMGTDRRAVVVLTDGRDEGSSIGLEGLLNRLPPTVSIHVIGFRSSGSFQPDPMRRIAAETSGLYLSTAKAEHLLDLYRQLAEELHSDYLLSYVAPEKPASTREVAVAVSLPQGERQATSRYSPPAAPPEVEQEEEAGTPWLWIGLAAGALTLSIILLVVLFVRSKSRARGEMPPEGRPEARPPVGAGLVTAGPYLVSGLYQFPLTATDVVIGRDPGAGIRLDDPRVSRLHARIYRNPDGLIVQDLGSANGTFLNDDRVEASFLADGDRLRIGDTEFLFRGTPG
jgi:Mg-chelatase subunit ChlD